PEARLQEHAVRAALSRLARRHRGMDAVAARLVARRRDHAAVADAADDHGLAAQGRIVMLLHGREERVHVGMQDDARPGCFAQLRFGGNSESTKRTASVTRSWSKLRRVSSASRQPRQTRSPLFASTMSMISVPSWKLRSHMSTTTPEPQRRHQ